jgi:hypothetical protein
MMAEGRGTKRFRPDYRQLRDYVLLVVKANNFIAFYSVEPIIDAFSADGEADSGGVRHEATRKRDRSAIAGQQSQRSHSSSQKDDGERGAGRVNSEHPRSASVESDERRMAVVSAVKLGSTSLASITFEYLQCEFTD